MSVARIRSLLWVFPLTLGISLVLSGGVRAQTPLDCARFLAANQFGELFSVDPSDGSATFIGFLPSPVTEIEFDVENGALYAEESAGGEGLLTVDPTTGALLDAVLHPFGALNGMEFVGSTLYATFIEGPQLASTLVTVDLSTGNLTPVGPTGFGPIAGLAYEQHRGIMYGVTSLDATLVTIDLATGAATPVAPVVDAAGQQLSRIGSIEFGPDGNLYGGLTDIGTPFPGYLVQIDTTTGEATPIGDTGFAMSGLTSCFSAVPVDIKAEACPTPLNVCARGLLPAAILGTEDFDVTHVDPASLMLVGVAPIRWALEDVATPFEPFTGKESADDCTDAGPDGLMDLTLKFRLKDVIGALGAVEDRDVVVLRLTGNLTEEFGGTFIVGEDVAVILTCRRSPSGAFLSMTSDLLR